MMHERTISGTGRFLGNKALDKAAEGARADLLLISEDGVAHEVSILLALLGPSIGGSG
jgi:hypothetical protein